MLWGAGLPATNVMRAENKSPSVESAESPVSEVSPRRYASRFAPGIVAVLAGVAIGVVALAAATTFSARTAEADTAHGAGGDAGVPAYIAAAGQGLVTPPDIEDVEHMCALLTSCDKLPFPPQSLPNSESSCVQAFMNELTSPEALTFSLTVRECGLRANSCSELRACALRGAKSDACSGRGQSGVVSICDLDGRAIDCLHEQVIRVRDCPRGGEQCIVREGSAACALGPCSSENKEGAAASCSASGTRVLQCDHGKLVSLDCGAFGLKCGVEAGKTRCEPSTPTCASTGKRCDGNVSVGCLHNHEVRVDCGAAGLTCNASPGSQPVGACVAPPPAAATDKCDPKDPPKCDGATIKYCFAGRKRSYFCKSLGFDKCAKDGNTVHCE